MVEALRVARGACALRVARCALRVARCALRVARARCALRVRVRVARALGTPCRDAGYPSAGAAIMAVVSRRRAPRWTRSLRPPPRPAPDTRADRLVRKKP